MGNIAIDKPAGTLWPRPEHKWVVIGGWLVFASCFLVITMASLQAVGAPSGHMYLDKIMHALAYGALTFGLIFARPKMPLKYVIGRTASLADAAANGFVALFIVGLWGAAYHLLKKRAPKF